MHLPFHSDGMTNGVRSPSANAADWVEYVSLLSPWILRLGFIEHRRPLEFPITCSLAALVCYPPLCPSVSLTSQFDIMILSSRVCPVRLSSVRCCFCSFAIFVSPPPDDGVSGVAIPPYSGPRIPAYCIMLVAGHCVSPAVTFLPSGG